MATFLFTLLRLVFFLVFPFILLIRGSVYFHTHYDWLPWLSVLGGGVVTAIILVIYMVFLRGSLTGKMSSAKAVKFKVFFAIFLVLGYSAHALFYF